MKTERQVRANRSPEKPRNQSPEQGDIVSAYIADQPREKLDQVAAMFLARSSARPAFLEFFRGLSRADYNRLVRALYGKPSLTARNSLR